MNKHNGNGTSIVVALAMFAIAGTLTALTGGAADAADGAAPAHTIEPVKIEEPADYRTDHYNSPVPATLKGARVVDPVTAMAEHEKRSSILIDVYPRAPKPAGLPPGTIWRSAKHLSIAGSYWLPNVGYGKLAPEPEAYFRAGLERLTGGDKAKSLVFFCLADCWMSWNAAKRAVEWGYTNIAWFPQGTDGWRDNGGDLVSVEPETFETASGPAAKPGP